MNIPGFTAESALYQSRRNYGSYYLRSGSSKSAVVSSVVTDLDFWQTTCDPSDPRSDCYTSPHNDDFWDNFPGGGPADDPGGSDRMPVDCWFECRGVHRYFCCMGEGWLKCWYKNTCPCECSWGKCIGREPCLEPLPQSGTRYPGSGPKGV